MYINIINILIGISTLLGLILFIIFIDNIVALLIGDKNSNELNIYQFIIYIFIIIIFIIILYKILDYIGIDDITKRATIVLYGPIISIVSVHLNDSIKQFIPQK